MLEFVNSTDGVVISGGRFRWFKAGGSGADGSRTMDDFRDADSGDNTSGGVADFRDGRGVGDFWEDVVFETSPAVVTRDHIGAAALVQEWADEGSHIDCLFVPLKDVSGGVVMQGVLHDVGGGFGGGDEGSHSYE